MRDRISATKASKKSKAAANLLALTTPMHPFTVLQITCNTETGE